MRSNDGDGFMAAAARKGDCHGRLAPLYILCQTSLMRTLPTTLRLRLAVLLIIATGSVGCSVGENIAVQVAYEVVPKLLNKTFGGVHHDATDYANDLPNDLTELKLLAEQGDADAQNKLGVMYDNGLRVPQNVKTARK